MQICLNTPIVCAVHWGADLCILYNDAYAPALAERHPWALSRPFGEVWAEIWDVLGPQIASVVETGRGFSTEHQLLRMHRNGRIEDIYWIYSFAPLHDGGAVAGIFVTALDTNNKVVVERRLTEEQERQRQMPGFRRDAVGPDLVYTYVNDAYVALSERTDFVGRRFRDVFADIERQGVFEAFENAFHSGEGVVTRGMELRLHGRDETQYVDFAFEPIRDDADAGTGLFVGGYETTGVYRGNEALRQSEERLRLAVDNAEVAFWDVDLFHDALIWPPRTKAMFGISADVPVTMADFYDALHPDDRAATSEAFAARLTHETLKYRVAEALAERQILADVIDGNDIFRPGCRPRLQLGRDQRAAADEFARIFGVRRLGRRQHAGDA